MAFFIYPALTVSRFDHSLGVMHLADQMLNTALEKSDQGIVDEFLKVCSETCK
jgi:HD superfamily phosphohydrolase